MAGCCCAEACTAAVLIVVMRLLGCPFDSAWCLVCEVCRLTVGWLDCRCVLSFVFLGGARRLGLSPCNTLIKDTTVLHIATPQATSLVHLCVLQLRLASCMNLFLIVCCFVLPRP